MRARPFQGEVVEGCVVRVSDGLRPRASALVHALVEQMKAHGHEAVAYNKGRYKGRCRFRFGEILCEVYVQENVSNDGIPGTIGRMKPTGRLYMGVRIAEWLHTYWFEADGKKLEDMLDENIIKLEWDVQSRHGATANPDEPIAVAKNKPVFGVRTDYRASQESGTNLMLSRGCNVMINRPSFDEDFDSLAKEIVRKLKKMLK